MPTPLDSGRDVCPPLNRNVIFLKERDIMLSNGVWRITIEVEMEPYAEALSIIRGEVLTAEGRKQKLTSNSETKLTLY